MSNLIRETVTSVHHWNDSLFSFTTTRNQGLRFKNGHFTTIGLEVENRPLLRAYSIASANYEEEMEFYSIKVPTGALTSRLQNLQVGDEVLVGTRTGGTLIVDNLLPGKNLYLLSTGTGLAPFMSIIKDLEIYDQFDKIILTHGVRHVSELAYQQRILEELPNNEYFGDIVREKLIYYPTVTREAFRNQGRLTDLISSGKLFDDIGLPQAHPDHDRFMLCGSQAMIRDLTDILEQQGFHAARKGDLGHYVIENAFIEK